jgi:hypothetical protein
MTSTHPDGLDRRRFLGLVAAVPATVALPALPAAAAAAPSADLFAEWSGNRNNHPQLPDSSYAGYKRGERSLPNPPVVATVTEFGGKPDGVTDNTTALRRAIDAAAARGGGAVSLPAGDFLVSGLVRLNRSGVVLRGAGRTQTRIVFTRNLRQIIGDNRQNDQSQWSYAGGLLWIAPADSFDSSGRLLNWDGTPVNLSGNTVNDWEQWRSGGFHQGRRLAKVTANATRGARSVTVNSTAGLRVGQIALMTWKNPGSSGGYSLLKHVGGSALLSSNYNWSSATLLLPPRTPRYRWPVKIESISGNTVRLAQPLRLDVRAVEWDVDFQDLGPSIQESGVERLTLALRGPTHPQETHLQHYGSNGVYLNRAVNCWVRDVDIDGGENGLMMSQVKQVTATGFAIRSPVRLHHATACRFMAADVLFQDFVVDPVRIYHGLNHEWLSSGIVWSRGLLAHGTFDSHRGLPFDNVRTEIIVARNDGAAGGNSAAGPRNGRRIVHWNVDNRGTSGTWVNQLDGLSSGALVGVRGPRDDSCSSGMVCGEKGSRRVDEGVVPTPANLYEAQRAARLG